MPNQQSIARSLLLYTLWADRTILRALRPVRPEDLERETGSSFPSLLTTMAHILGAEKIWLARFLGSTVEPFPTPYDYPDLISLLHGWEETAAGIEAFLAGLNDEQLDADITWTNFRGETYTQPLWELVSHLVNHSTYHRGQLVTMLRQMGYEVPSTDLVYYLNDRG